MNSLRILGLQCIGISLFTPILRMRRPPGRAVIEVYRTGTSRAVVPAVPYTSTVKKVHSVHTIRTRQKGSEVSPAFSAPGTKTYLEIGSHSCVICLLHVSILRTTGQPLVVH